LVVVLDSDDTAIHDKSHGEPESNNEDCRLCKAMSIISRVRKHLKPRAGLPELKIAIGLAVPAIEAWYLVGREHQIGEAAWKVAVSDRKLPFTRSDLKVKVYGTNRPSLELETECAVREATRIVNGNRLPELQAFFPDGFGSMAEEIRKWIETNQPEEGESQSV
jgi:hypothetical protein